MATYHWYPGHMAKARRAMDEDIKIIDVIVEILDARIPLSSRNPDLISMGNGKERIIILNKADLASENTTREWTEHFMEDGYRAVSMNSRDKRSFSAVMKAIDSAAEKKRERDAKRGIKNRPVRLLVCGIPNVGKSTFINSLCKRNIAKTGNKPGVTKGKQWISVRNGVELMDTPGILWPRIDDPVSQKNLALVGSMNDEAINRDDLFLELASVLMERVFPVMHEKYDIERTDDAALILEKTAGTLSMKRSGGAYDTDRAREFLFTAFRGGELGRISLEEP